MKTAGFLFAFAVASFAVPLNGYAATQTWDGGAGGAGTELGTAVNWGGDVLPANSDILQWDGTAAGSLSLTYNVAAAGSFNTNPGVSINVTSTQTSSLSITGTQTLRLNGSGITIASGAGAFTLGTAGLTVFNGPMTLTNNSSNTATLNSGIAFGTTSAGVTTFQFGGSGNWAVNSNLGSTNNPAIGTSTNIVTKSGAGTLTLGVANTYVGATTVSGGTLNLSNQSAIQSSTLTMNGGSVVFDSSVGGNAFTVGGLSAASSGAGFDIALQNNAGVPVAIALTVGSANNLSSSYAGVLSGAGSLIKAGTGTLRLAGANTYTGLTTVNAGTLALANTSAKSAGTSISVAAGAGLALGVSGVGAFTASDVSALLSDSMPGVTLDPAALSGVDTLTDNAVLPGVISGSRALTKTGANYILTLSGANTNSGGTTVSSGAIQYANPAAMPAVGAVSALTGTTIAVNAGGVGEFSTATSGAGSIGGLLGGIGGQGAAVNLPAGSSVGIDTTNAGATVTYAGAFTSANNVGLVKLGTGTLELTNGGTYVGGGGPGFPLVVRQGTLLLNGGTHAVTGELALGGTFSTAAGATGYNAKLQVDSGSLTISSWLSVGRGNGVGVVSSDLEVNNSATVTAGNFSGGFNGGSALNTPKGSVTLNGSSILSVANDVNIAESPGSNITINVNGTSIFRQTANAAQTRLGGGDNAVGIINVNGGTATFERDFVLGFAGTGTGRLVLNSGTVNIANATERWLKVNDTQGSKGELTVNGGNLNLNTSTDIRFSTNANAAGTSFVTLNAGAISGYTGNNNGIFSGTSVVDLNQASTTGTINNTFNLNGGTLTIGQVITTQNSGTAAFNFNGGTLKAAAASATFLDLGGATQKANVKTGGAIIDSNGFAITIPQALEAGPGGSGGLTKTGAGTLTLSGVNTYTGGTTVNGGTLALASTGTLASTAYTVANGAILNLSAKASYSLSSINLTLGSNGTTAGLLNGGALSMTLGGNLVINFTAAIGGTSFNLLDYGSQTGDFGTVSLTGSVAGSLTLTGADTWTGGFGGFHYSFSEIDGILSVTAVPEPHEYALAISCMLAVVIMLRRRRATV